MDLVSIGWFALGLLAGSVIVGCGILCFAAWESRQAARRWTADEDIDVAAIADTIGSGSVGTCGESCSCDDSRRWGAA